MKEEKRVKNLLENRFIVLGIETSCDETAVSIIDSNKVILANTIYSQVDIHKNYGGVVPELAARNHIEILPELVKAALSEAKLKLTSIDAIAVTAGPGLIGGVIVGVMLAKGMASVLKIPCIPVNHLEAHALTIRLTNSINFPYLLLLLSGGHCQILIVKGVNEYEMLGSTLDDAIGEAFDKVAKMLGLGYPGGPIVEKLASIGDPAIIPLPRPLLKQKNCNFSFSGLKTAVRQQIEILKASGELTEKDKANICAAFQDSVCEILADRLSQACNLLENKFNILDKIENVIIAGGVAANSFIKNRLNLVAASYGLKLSSPPPYLCTDNAAMVAWAGIERLNFLSNNSYGQDLLMDLTFTPKSRWPLVEQAN